MDVFSTSFEYLYPVSSDGSNTLDPSQPLAVDIQVADPHSSLGDDSVFQVSGSDGPFDGSYTFVSKAVTAGGQQGFIAKDAGGHSYFISNSLPTGGVAPLTPEPGSVPICFMAGTAIDVPGGKVPVETLAIGDLVSTSDGRAAPVRWVGRQTIVRIFADTTHLPICIKAGALGEQRPARDLIVSPNHAVLVDDVLVQAGCLVNEISIVRMNDVPASFVYYHVELDRHDLILAEGVAAETFLDAVDRTRFDNWDEHERLYGAAAPMAELNYPRAKARRQLPAALRARLAARALDLYGTAHSQAA